MRIHDLKQKKVINVKTCKRLGFVGDVNFDMETDCLLALIVPGPGYICGFLGREKEYVIPLCDICQVGSDIILVDTKEKDVTESIKYWKETYSADSSGIRALFSAWDRGMAARVSPADRLARKSCMKSICFLQV